MKNNKQKRTKRNIKKKEKDCFQEQKYNLQKKQKKKKL